MVASAHDLNDVATKNYINYIGIIDAERSWVARVIQKPPTCPDGVYAEALSDEDEFDEEEEGADEFSRGVEVGPGREGSEDANAIESRYM
ncbi:transcription elongation factor SPT4 [Angomonas deanei]|uniref:Uncharacterized protein n=1 Tax=Angomonas deanei TaxID=59799 RepID=A0A7G2CAL6_9TRYP|nr:transcription elongation factor SPT4 [Angomonas deanei]CAD2216798.1 hypothetical protein, conserved [Angomonas deanei]|eukprot:EPY23508.1 transcription elongation factor SPT4 [Angomonas deanei]